MLDLQALPQQRPYSTPNHSSFDWLNPFDYLLPFQYAFSEVIKAIACCFLAIVSLIVHFVRPLPQQTAADPWYGCHQISLQSFKYWNWLSAQYLKGSFHPGMRRLLALKVPQTSASMLLRLQFLLYALTHLFCHAFRSIFCPGPLTSSSSEQSLSQQQFSGARDRWLPTTAGL